MALYRGVGDGVNKVKKDDRLVPGFIRVSSGGYSGLVKADTVKEAFKLFVTEHKPKQLGQLVEFYGLSIDDPEHTSYGSCQRFLEDLGWWAGKL